MRTAMALAIALALGTGGAAAQSDRPDTEGGRYILRNVDDGMLRVDRETGATSICREDGAGWACRVVPDERDALQDEIASLAEENSELARRVGELEDRLVALGENPDSVGDEPAAEGQPDASEEEFSLDLPSEAELDQLMETFESMMRRFLGMVRSLKEDYTGEEQQP